MNKGSFKDKAIISGSWAAIWLNALVITFIITIMINSCVPFIPEPQRVTFNFWFYGVILSCFFTALYLIISIIRSCKTKKISIILLVDIIAVLLCFLVGTGYNNRLIWGSLCLIDYPLHINILVSGFNSKNSFYAIPSALIYGIIPFAVLTSIMYIKIPWYRSFIIIDVFVFIFLWLLSCYWIKLKQNNKHS